MNCFEKGVADSLNGRSGRDNFCCGVGQDGDSDTNSEVFSFLSCN